ncbi:DUF6246 family protein [Tatumella terrea]|uniref:DUF6246 family protein n=1 Tax=Tatumella terrea TaxID=419007 RepID=UPI0031D5025D
MTPIKEIGECVISVGDTDYFFRPSFANMTKIGTPEEIVSTFYALHNDNLSQLIVGALSVFGRLPEWFLRYLNNSAEGKAAFVAAVTVMDACCETDATPLTGEIAPSRTGKRAFIWRKGRIDANDLIVIASELIIHGIIGRAKVRLLQRHESKATVKEFRAVEYINAARNHFGMARTEAENLTMTEFILLLNAKYPEQKGFTREEYDKVVDDYFVMKDKRMKG